jgi:hypothetical protein
MTCRQVPKIVPGSSRQSALNPPCLPAGYTLVSGSSSRRMDYLPGIIDGSQMAHSKGILAQ